MPAIEALKDKYGIKARKEVCMPYEDTTNKMECLVVSDKDFFKYFNSHSTTIKIKIVPRLWFRGNPILSETFLKWRKEKQKAEEHFAKSMKESRESNPKEN